MDGTLANRLRSASALPAAANDRPIGRADGAIELIVDRRNERARVQHLYQRQPLRVLLPKPAGGEPLTAVLANLSGGMVGGDIHDVSVVVEEGADALVCGQAAEKVYRSTGADTRVAAGMAVEDGATLEWLPQGTILFDGSRLNRRTTVNVAAGGCLLAGEVLVFGRLGMGEVMRSGLLRDHWRLAVDGRLVWADALTLDDDIGAVLDHPAGLGGGRALATVVHAAPSADTWLEPARAILAEAGGADMRAAATAWPGVLLVRMLGPDPATLRRAFGHCWTWLRAATLGRPATMPVLWTI